MRRSILAAVIVAALTIGGVAGAAGGALFSPDRSITRAEVVTMIWRAHGSPSASPATFVDVDQGAYYADAVGWAQSTGVTTGTGYAIVDPVPWYVWAPAVEAAVADAAAEFGVSLSLLASIIQCESHGNPDAQNPRSSASGLGQFLDGTWNAYAPDLGYPPTRAASYGIVAGARVTAYVMSISGTAPWNASRHCWGS